MKRIDKIRQMSVQEFEKKFLQQSGCRFCVYEDSKCSDKDCVEGRIKWLNEES